MKRVKRTYRVSGTDADDRVFVLHDGTRLSYGDWLDRELANAFTQNSHSVGTWLDIASRMLRKEILAVEVDGSIRCGTPCDSGRTNYCLRRVKEAGQRCPTHREPLAKAVMGAMKRAGKQRR